MADSAGFFGGLSSGFSDARDAALAQQKQDALESNDAKVRAQQQVSSTLSYINEVVKAASAQGTDNKKILTAIEPLVQSASGVAQAAGMDPNYVRQAAQLITMRPAQSPDSDHTVVPIGESATGRQYGVLNKRTGEVAPIGGAAQPSSPVSPGQSVNLTGDNSTVTGVDVQGSPSSAFPSSAPSNAVPQPSVPAQVPPLSPGGNVPQQRASLADRFAAVNDTGTVSDVGAPGATNGLPRIPANMQPGQDAVNYAVTNNVTGDEFLNKAVPEKLRGLVKDIAEYRIDPKSLSIKGGHREELLGLASQYSGHTYDQKYYGPMSASIKEFLAGGNTSPAGQITAGNTAIQHLGEVADAVEKMKSIPGLLDKVAKSGTPVASYAAEALKNKAIRGTSEGRALQDFLTARNHYAEEATKFYSGSGGSEAERERSIQTLDASLSAPELYSALNTETKLLNGKINALQDRWKTALAGPKLYDSTIRSAVPDFPIIQEKSAKAMMRVQALDRQYGGGDSGHGASPGVVDFRTYFGK